MVIMETMVPMIIVGVSSMMVLLPKGSGGGSGNGGFDGDAGSGMVRWWLQVLRWS